MVGLDPLRNWLVLDLNGRPKQLVFSLSDQPSTLVDKFLIEVDGISMELVGFLVGVAEFFREVIRFSIEVVRILAMVVQILALAEYCTYSCTIFSLS